MRNHEFDNTGQDGEPPTKECRCGNEVELWNTLENVCSECGNKYNGSGQKLQSDWRNEARKQGNLRSDPPVGGRY